SPNTFYTRRSSPFAQPASKSPDKAGHFHLGMVEGCGTLASACSKRISDQKENLTLKDMP
ncbi:MAG: hypothetical protein OEY57_15605, partial [Nitrospirota bacterium]|nr:hypothetical protein [Nitrospirota bacterium]